MSDDASQGGDRLIYGAQTSSGHYWNVTGSGALTAAYSGGRIVSTGGTLYAYVEPLSAFTRMDVRFSMVLGSGDNDDSTSMLVLIIDNGAPPDHLKTMLHFLLSPTSWTLQKRIAEGSLDYVDGGSHTLTVGASYRMGIERLSSTSVRLHLPNGTTKDVTDADFANVRWWYPAIEINNSTDSWVGRFESLTVRDARGAASVIDRFDRADGALGADWTTVAEINGAIAVASGQAVGQASANPGYGIYNYNASFGPDQEVSAKITAGGADAWAILRLRAAPDSFAGYGVGVAVGAGAVIVSFDAMGTPTLRAMSGSWTNGDTLRARIVGDEITVYQNDALVLTTTDSTYASGGIGLLSKKTTDPIIFDDFHASDAPTF